MYLHWDKLIYREPPEGLTHEEWWALIKVQRRLRYERLPFVDQTEQPFVYLRTDEIDETLHEIDLSTAGSISLSEAIKNSDVQERYYVDSLMAEAITSSQLEGATTTRQVARQMIRTGRKPSDRSEQMILNNFITMKRIHDLRKEEMSEELLCEIHRLVTDSTLDVPDASGRFRSETESTAVMDDHNNVFYTPPPARVISHRMKRVYKFANGRAPSKFLHPVLRSIILHFMIGYEHPFVDGNGRTARALFYWSMLKNGYWVFEYLSISQAILRGPAKYARAFLYPETDENDLTYFLIYHLDVIKRAIQELLAYIKRKTAELQELESRIKAVVVLNHRQRALICHALRHSGAIYTVISHQTSHGVSNNTARTDLQDLYSRGLLIRNKRAREWHFQPAADMEENLARLD